MNLKDASSSHASSHILSKPSSLINIAKQVWKRGLNFADRLISLAIIFNPQNESKPANAGKKINHQEKECYQEALGCSNKKAEHYQNQEPMKISEVQSLKCRLPISRDRSLWGLKDNNQKVQADDYFEEYIEKKIQTTKIVIEMKPGKNGYVNVDEFLKKLKQIREDKKTRNQLKISRDQFINMQNLPSESQKTQPTQKAKSLFELLNPGKEEDKPKGPRQLRTELRDNIFKKAIERKNILKGQMTETSSSENDKYSEQKAPKIEKSDNSTIYENSEQDQFEKSTDIIEQADDKNEIKTNKECQQKPETQPTSQAQQKLIQINAPLHAIQQKQPPVVQAFQPLPQQQPKCNPFLSSVVPEHQQNHSQFTQNQNEAKNVVEEMKKKLFGNTNTQQQTNFVNNLPKSVSNFGFGLQNTFSSNYSCTKPSFLVETLKNSLMNPPVLTFPTSFGQGFQQNHSLPQVFNQPTMSPFIIPPQQQNYQQLRTPQNQILNQVPNVMIPSQQVPFSNPTTGFSHFNNNQTPSFLKPHTSIPMNPIFGNPCSSTIFPPPNNNSLASKAFGHLIKPNLLNDEKNKILLKSFLTPSGNNSFCSNPKASDGLFSKIVDHEDDWDRRTERKARNTSINNRKREKKEDRVR